MVHPLQVVAESGLEVVRKLREWTSRPVIILSARNTSCGESQTQVAAQLEGPPLVAGFNARYLADVAHQVGDAEMVCEIEDPSSPMRVLDASDPYVTFVVMPVRV